MSSGVLTPKASEALQEIAQLAEAITIRVDTIAEGIESCAVVEERDRYKAALEEALDIALQSVDDPDTVLIERIQQALGGDDAG